MNHNRRHEDDDLTLFLAQASHLLKYTRAIYFWFCILGIIIIRGIIWISSPRWIYEIFYSTCSTFHLSVPAKGDFTEIGRSALNQLTIGEVIPGTIDLYQYFRDASLIKPGIQSIRVYSFISHFWSIVKFFWSDQISSFSPSLSLRSVNNRSTTVHRLLVNERPPSRSRWSNHNKSHR